MRRDIIKTAEVVMHQPTSGNLPSSHSIRAAHKYLLLALKNMEKIEWNDSEDSTLCWGGDVHVCLW